MYLPYLATGSPNTILYIQFLYTIFAVIFAYLFITLGKLLRKIKVNNVSVDIYLISILSLVSSILGQLLYAFYNASSFSPHHELGLLFLGCILLRIILGVVVIRFASKLKKYNDKTDFLESYPDWIKVSGVLYVISGLVAGNPIFSVIADIITVIILSNLFSKAAKGIDNSFTGFENSSTHQ